MQTSLINFSKYMDVSEPGLKDVPLFVPVTNIEGEDSFIVWRLNKETVEAWDSIAASALRSRIDGVQEGIWGLTPECTHESYKAIFDAKKELWLVQGNATSSDSQFVSNCFMTRNVLRDAFLKALSIAGGAFMFVPKRESSVMLFKHDLLDVSDSLHRLLYQGLFQESRRPVADLEMLSSYVFDF
jgi:hypothetical protein